jgi:hypothetical protein
MASQVISFRLNEGETEVLEAQKLEGESLSQTAQRLLRESLGVPAAGRLMSTAPLTPENIPGLEEFVLRVVREDQGGVNLVGELRT